MPVSTLTKPHRHQAAIDLLVNDCTVRRITAWTDADTERCVDKVKTIINPLVVFQLDADGWCNIYLKEYSDQSPCKVFLCAERPEDVKNRMTQISQLIKTDVLRISGTGRVLEFVAEYQG